MIRVEGLIVTFGERAKAVRAVDRVGFRVARGRAPSAWSARAAPARARCCAPSPG